MPAWSIGLVERLNTTLDDQHACPSTRMCAHLRSVSHGTWWLQPLAWASLTVVAAVP